MRAEILTEVLQTNMDASAVKKKEDVGIPIYGD